MSLAGKMAINTVKGPVPKAQVFCDGLLQGEFNLDPDNRTEIDKAENLGVDMLFACYVYEAQHGKKVAR